MKYFNLRLPILVLAVSAYLAACSSTPPTPQSTPKTDTKSASETPLYKGGAYYKDDGPGLNTPENLDAVPDAVPRVEPLHPYANNPYKVLGKNYTPMISNVGYKQVGKASWYGRKFHGKPTASGEPYDMYAMTAAHPTLPIPSYARVTNTENGKSVVVRINDRGPFHDDRIIDLSYAAAYKLGVLKGVTPVIVEAVLPETATTSFAAQAAEDVAEPASQPVTLAAAPAPEVKPHAAKPTVSYTVSYYLQLGAFSSQARAHDLLKKVAARLPRTFTGVLRIAFVDGLYKVQAGPYVTPEEADRAAALLRKEMGLKAFKVVSDPRKASAETVIPAQSAMASVFGPYLLLAAGSPPAATRLSIAYQQDFGIEPYQVTR